MKEKRSAESPKYRKNDQTGWKQNCKQDVLACRYFTRLLKQDPNAAVTGHSRRNFAYMCHVCSDKLTLLCDVQCACLGVVKLFNSCVLVFWKRIGNKSKNEKKRSTMSAERKTTSPNKLTIEYWSSLSSGQHAYGPRQLQNFKIHRNRMDFNGAKNKK